MTNPFPQAVQDALDAIDRPDGIDLRITGWAVHLLGCVEVHITAAVAPCPRPLAPPLHGPPPTEHGHAMTSAGHCLTTEPGPWLHTLAGAAVAAVQTSVEAGHHAAACVYN